MLEKRLKDRAERLIEVRISERRQQLPRDIGQIKSRAAGHGAFHSSNTMLAIHGAFARELEIRSIICWECLVRVHRILGAVHCENLASDLKDYMHSFIEKTRNELDEFLNNELKTFQPHKLTLDDAQRHANQKHDIEIDLYCDSLQAQETDTEIQSLAAKQEYYFYGTVGAVQTGANAIANVVQNIGADDKQALTDALNLVRESIGAIQNLAEVQKEELVQVVDECRAEITSEKPNNTRLRALLSTVATSIQTIASAQPAYQAVKGALLPLGIVLP